MRFLKIVVASWLGHMAGVATMSGILVAVRRYKRRARATKIETWKDRIGQIEDTYSETEVDAA